MEFKNKIVWKTGSRTTELVEKEGVPFLQYRILQKEAAVVHGFSTRLGGVSTGDAASMNLSFNRDKSRAAVEENYRRIGNAIGFYPEQAVASHQTHTTNIRLVTEQDRGKGVVRPADYTDVDGFITDTPGIMLVTSYADCVPLYFFDKKNRAIGLSHSGWRGTVNRMGKVTLQRMKENFGTNPEDVICCIGPSICQDCYEVSGDVIGQFRENFEEKDWNALYYKKKNGKYQLNLWEANRRILLQAGVPEGQIAMPDICTCCNPELLFSHRASKGRRGNLSAFLMLKET